ncbi:MAG: NDP-sugar synthase [Acidobacteriota bacterium]
MPKGKRARPAPRTAVMIAGGSGERLRPLTAEIPKALVPVGGRPLFGWISDWLRSEGIERLVLGVAHRKERLIEAAAGLEATGLDVAISEHSVDGGTAEAFRLAIERHVDDEHFLALNCDELTNLSVARLADHHARTGALVTMALAPLECRFSVVDLRGDGIIRGFRYGHTLPFVPLSIGVYLFDRRVLGHIPAAGSIEDATFTPLAEDGRIAGLMLAEGEEWISVNSMKDLRHAEQRLATLFPGRYPVPS